VIFRGLKFPPNNEIGENSHLWMDTNYGTGVSQNVSTTESSADGATAKRADAKHFTFTKHIDSSSPKLSQACAAGTHL
jgi:type VI secretion system secreted protein Hcp